MKRRMTNRTGTEAVHTHTHTLGSVKEVKRKRDKKQSDATLGITLVALVVTVVVLLILAGITIMYVMGDNSVFNQASQAKIQTELGKIEEQARTIYYDKLMANQGTSNKITNGDIVDELNRKGSKIETRSAGGSITGIRLEPATVSIDQSQTATIKVKLERPEDGNFYYAVVDGKYYKMNFKNNALTIEREASTPEGNTEESANIEVATGYDETIVTNVKINQTEKTIAITSGTTYKNTELTVKYGSKTAKCTVKVEEAESNWAEIAEMAKAIANDSSITNSSPQATVTVNGASKTIKVGDILKVKYDGAIRRVRVLGFKHDDLVNNGIYGGNHTKASISFEFYDLMTGDTYMAMNENNSNANGWGSSDMRRDLNGYEKNATTGLIADEQSGAIGGLGAKISNRGYIKQVKKQYIQTYNVASTNNHYAYDYLWLLAASEVVNAGYQTNAYGYAITTEGSQYKYYQGVTKAWNEASEGRVKYNGSGIGFIWYLRSPHYDYAFTFCHVSGNRQCQILHHKRGRWAWCFARLFNLGASSTKISRLWVLTHNLEILISSHSLVTGNLTLQGKNIPASSESWGKTGNSRPKRRQLGVGVSIEPRKEAENQKADIFRCYRMQHFKVRK